MTAILNQFYGFCFFVIVPSLFSEYDYRMSYEQVPKIESESNPERILPREEVLRQLRSRCEDFAIERELADAEGVYLLEVISSDNTKRYVYQRKGSFPGKVQKIESTGTTIRSEDMEDGYSRTIADYDETTGEWIDQ